MISLEFLRLKPREGGENKEHKDKIKTKTKQRDKRNHTSKTNGYSGQDYGYFLKIF